MNKNNIQARGTLGVRTCLVKRHGKFAVTVSYFTYERTYILDTIKDAFSLIECVHTRPADICIEREETQIRHTGHWKEDETTGSLMCSVCGHFTDEILGDIISADTDIAKALHIPVGAKIHRSMHPVFCSRCGAKME